ncbi:putative NAD(P)H nitroreductase [Maritalea myrionectae]|uniref:Putative NAD(P)H nitroreductase n=1 Tax=Maritalea myrionectae TaxID=454601 RepID=A0A2R4ME25_9HYPH|nr:nitroreductase [Maritalea myrionectae]AVX04174.1 putative NAD(P)H nitroreductase [Maritalea myrionectae]
MPQHDALIDYLKNRRSVTAPFLTNPGPTVAELDQIMEIGARVPDHGKIVPWRMVVYQGAMREIVGEKLADIWQQKHPEADDETLDVERKRFLPAPLTIGVLARPQKHPKVPELEQLLSAGCVCFNLVHAAHAHGYAAHWVTRWFSFDADAATMLGAGADEQFVGFVHIGTPEVAPQERDRPRLKDVVSYWHE